MRDQQSGWIQLHPGELFLLWQALDLGELPAILGIPHIGRTAAARADMIAGASESLAGRDLGTVEAPARDLQRLLRILGEPELLLDLHAEAPEVSFRAVSGSGPYGAASVGVSGTEVRLGPVREPGMIAGLFEAIAPAPAGVGRTGNVRVADYEAACTVGERDGSAGFAAALRDAGLRPPEVNTVVRAVTERVGGGQFGAGVRLRSGRWARCPSALTWLDTADGRYAMRVKGEWMSVTPADPALLNSMATELVGDLRG